jgi:NTE family protein
MENAVVDLQKSFAIQASAAPVTDIDSREAVAPLEHGIALCLSGGGYRAMVFHAGALIRLNESGLLHKLERVSSVSGGSITAGVLGMAWPQLQFNAAGTAANLGGLVIQPIRTLASHTIDVGSVLSGVFWWGSVADKIAGRYRKYLFKDATLQDLPDRPRFVFNATNVQSKALWRFSKPYMRDWRVGEVRNPTIDLAVAVAASSAFPPVLSPAVLELKESDYTPKTGSGLQRPPFTTGVVLTDGGVYDNLGLETVWKRYDTVLVSDAGGVYGVEEHPARDWLNHTRRVVDMIDNQVRSLRKRQVIDSFQSGIRNGCYWGIWTDITNYRLPTALDAPYAKTALIASTPTRLKALDSSSQQRLMNWGYSVCDAAIRKHLDPALPAPVGFPFPGGVG